MPLKASPEEIARFAGEMEKRHGDLVNMINQVKANEDGTTATWSGYARASFDQFMERYYGLARQLNDQLANTADSVAAAGRRYGAADSDYSSAIAGKASSLDMS